ncbi:MAG: YdeI/OmpD-associated family protein [Anaerolineae bacterium]
MTIQRFDAAIEPLGARAGVVVPFDPNEAWGRKPQHHVTGTIAGRKIRGPLALDGGRWLLVLGPAWRRDNDLDVGAMVNVEIAPEGPQPGALAPDVAAALAAEPKAQAFFDGLATFYRKGYVNWIESAKRPATREARIAAMMECLRAERKRR